MSYKIIVDSCCELPEQLKNDPRFQSIPLILQVGDEHILDDEKFNQAEFLAKVAACPEAPRSACPSPEKYRDACICDADHIYLVTLSAKLSGSYNSAVVGVDLFEEECPEAKDKKVVVIDSKSASCGEAQIALRLMEWEEAGMSFEEIVQKARDFADHQLTYFVLDSLETFRKNGRLTGVKSLVVSTMNIKPVMAGVDGDIVQKGQGIGNKKALNKMVEILISELKDKTDRKIMITHCNCPNRAETVQGKLQELLPELDIMVLDMAGLSSLYAGDGGVIVTV